MADEAPAEKKDVTKAVVHTYPLIRVSIKAYRLLNTLVNRTVSHSFVSLPTGDDLVLRE